MTKPWNQFSNPFLPSLFIAASISSRYQTASYLIVKWKNFLSAHSVLQFHKEGPKRVLLVLQSQKVFLVKQLFLWSDYYLNICPVNGGDAIYYRNILSLFSELQIPSPLITSLSNQPYWHSDFFLHKGCVLSSEASNPLL